jgi:hypothetical protein
MNSIIGYALLILFVAAMVVSAIPFALLNEYFGFGKTVNGIIASTFILAWGALFVMIDNKRARREYFRGLKREEAAISADKRDGRALSNEEIEAQVFGHDRHIVERLRDPWVESFGDRLEAADEIEKLRAALREIAKRAADDSPWCAEIARAALKGKP